MNFARTAVAVCFALALTSSARGETSIGKATSVIPAADYARGAQLASLSVNDEMQQDDRVKTSGKGSTQIKFVDGTVLTIGPNSEVVLDKMIFDGDRAQNATIRVVRGAMRFASGTSDHSAYHIETKVATIGVRGTVIDVSMENDKMIYATVEGDAEVCNQNVGLGCRRVRAGDPAIAVNLAGFTRATAREALKLFRGLNDVSTTLVRNAGLILQNTGETASKVVGGTIDAVGKTTEGVAKGVEGTAQAVGKTTEQIGRGVGEGIKKTLQFKSPF
jgi:hypothetical protein